MQSNARDILLLRGDSFPSFAKQLNSTWLTNGSKGRKISLQIETANTYRVRRSSLGGAEKA